MRSHSLDRKDCRPSPKTAGRQAGMIKSVRKVILFMAPLLSLLFSLFFTAPLFAVSDEEKTFLSLYFKDEELQVISATRSLKSVTRVAENVTVVTAEEIELMNAHTVAEVLNTVTGIQMDIKGGPGSIAIYEIQSSNYMRVAVFIDGVSITSLSDDIAMLGFIPVQNIERIEIIKGPASSAWGSSLGGVINIITKPAGGTKTLNGVLSASYGEQNTGDFRFEAHGKKDKAGYYLYAGRLQSDGLNGLRPNNDVSENSLFAKLSYDMAHDTNMQLSLFYNKNTLGIGEIREYDYADFYKATQFLSTLSFNTLITEDMELNILLKQFRLKTDFTEETVSTGERLYYSVNEDNLYGASAKMTWKKKAHTIVAGIDYDEGTYDNNLIDDSIKQRKWGLFANDTLVLDKLSITPGIRYDHTNLYNDFTSPSLGITYEIFHDTILRGYVAKGFHRPGLATSTSSELMGYMGNPDIKPEKVWSYQLGVETGALKYLWMKVSAFRHDVEDVFIDHVITDDPILWTRTNGGSQRRIGIEMEVKTIPVYNTVFHAGAMFMDISCANDNVAFSKYTYDIGLQYDDKKSLKASLKGHYIWWMNAYYGDYNSFVFDLNVIKKIYEKDDRTLEAFLTGHNIFNASQYSTGIIYSNPRRWIEAGVRVKF